MNRSSQRRILFLASASFLLLAGAVWYMAVHSESDETTGRFQRGETLLIISNSDAFTTNLFKAGGDLSTVSHIADFDGKSLWLPAGNYFITASIDGTDRYYPVPLKGFRQGPEEDGSFRITLRVLPAETPPGILPDQEDYLLIPSGDFLIGDHRNPREQHYAWLSSYYIAQFEVSNEEFRSFLTAKDGYVDDRNWTQEGREWKHRTRSQVSAHYGPSDKEYLRFGQPDQPVTWVTWYEANAFCKWLSMRFAAERWLFTLPTDAEWEKAARGPDNFDYSLGSTLSDAQVNIYNWKKNPWEEKTVAGKEETLVNYKPNRYGLYHMTGNVVEWSQSVMTPFNRDHPYADDNRNHDDTHGQRSARGGSWYSAAISYLYIPYRDAFQPEHCSQDVGFRVVCRKLP